MLGLLICGVCNDYVLATVLTIVKRALTLIQIVVPIILIVSVIIQAIKLVLNPDDDKKGIKKIINSFISAVIIFFIPMVINLSMNLISDYGYDNDGNKVGIVNKNGKTKAFNVSNCWKDVARVQDAMDSTRENGGNSSSTIKKEENKKKSTLGSGVNSGGTSSSSSYSSSASGLISNGATSIGVGNQVIDYAKQFVGNPYSWGGTDLIKGADCSGFVQQVYKKFGYDIPRTSLEQRSVGKSVADLSQAKAGDIICYDGHVALFMGDGNKIVHAKSAYDGITISDNAAYQNILSIRRVIE